MTKNMKATAALLVGALLLAGTLPASAQQAPANGTGTRSGSGRNLGPGDGTELRPAPRDGTGFGSFFGGVSQLNGPRGAASGTQSGTPQGSRGSSSQGASSRRGRG